MTYKHYVTGSVCGAQITLLGIMDNHTPIVQATWGIKYVSLQIT